MSGSASVMARLLAVAFFIVVGMGVYTFNMKTNLDAATQQLEDVSKDRDTWKTRLTQFQSQNTTTKADLDSCNGKVTDLQAQVDAFNAAATKKTAAPARR